MEFNPERFLGDNPEPDPRLTVFGYGRRICEYRYFVTPPPNKRNFSGSCVGPGLNVAQTSLWIACAMSLAMLDIEKCIDEFGNVVEPEVCYQDGVIR